MPNNFIGKLLDRGKPSAAAIKLLAIKFALGGPGFVVSKHRAAAHGMGWREYRSGLKLLKAAGIIRRWQDGRRSFPTERLITAASRNYVEIDAGLLGQPASVVAFILAANLSPKASRPAELGRRIGISSPATVRGITKAAIATGAVAVSRPRKGPHLVARPGTVFDGWQNNHPVKNGATKIGAALSNRKISSESERDSPADLESLLLKGGAPELSEHEHAEEIAEELRNADIAGALAAPLLTPAGIRGYLALIPRHGAVARVAVMAKLAGFAIDGVPPGQVWTWEFFNGPIADEAKLTSMVERGERPGDVFGFHRKIKLET